MSIRGSALNLVYEENQAVPRLRLLLVEDCESDALLVEDALHHAYPQTFDIAVAHTIEEALPCLSLESFDAILLDFSLPGCSGLEALLSVRTAAPLTPVLMLTGHNDESLAFSALKHGAQDYLLKEQIDGRVIHRALRYAIERKQCEGSLVWKANYDELTGLPNRAFFTSCLEMALRRAARSHAAMAVFFIDLDRFKGVNDTYGHEAGDTVLKAVAGRLRQALRESDMVVRLGGDEFAVLLEGKASPRDCAMVAQKLIDAMAPPISLKGSEVSIGVSIGIATGDTETQAEGLLKRADAAMYRAKAVNGSNYQFYTLDMHRKASERIQLERELGDALRNPQSLMLYYQPKLDMESGRLAGAEALLRWDHPTRGMLAPADFLPLLQDAEVAERLDAWVMETVCRDICAWKAAGLAPIQVSLHITHRQWHDGEALAALMDILQQSGVDAQHLALEMEESAVLHQDEAGFTTVSRVREMGVAVHLDNFGADISSLKLLTRCPLDILKVDRRLVHQIQRGDKPSVLIQALVEIGHQLGMKVIAEGVETEAQRDALATMRCDQIQGVVVSKPLPGNEFFNWMGVRQQQEG